MQNTIDRYSMMIICKYFNRDRDFVNVMKVNTTYKDIVDMYHYNPTNRVDLFENAETVYMYKHYFDYNDLDKDDMIEELKRILRMEKVMKVVVEEEMCYKKYMKVMKSLGNLNNKQVEIRNVVYTNMDRKTYGEQIPEGVTIINEKYFKGIKSMENITLPSTIRELSESCLDEFTKVVNIDAKSHKINYRVSYDMSKRLQSKGITCTNIIYTMKDRSLWYSKEERIPNVKKIGNNCFKFCYTMQSIEIPDTVEELGDGCFYSCVELKSIKLPESIRSIGKQCFTLCKSLKNIQIPGKVQNISFQCFKECENLESIVLPQTVSSISWESFSECKKLNKINIPENVRSIGDSCFSNCTSLEEIKLPTGLESIPTECFYNCMKLVKADIPSSIKNYGTRCFRYCNDINHTLPIYCF